MKFVFWPLVIIFTTVVAYSLANVDSEEFIFPAHVKVPEVITVNSYESVNLSDVIEKRLQKIDYDISVYIKNLKTAEEYRYNEKEVYASASLYKLWVMGAVYEEIAQERLTEDTVFSDSISSLNSHFGIDLRYAERRSGGISETVEDSLKNMIENSDNYSALLLASKIGGGKITDFLKKHKLNGSDYGDSQTDPTTTAPDVGIILEKIYLNRLSRPEDSRKMMNLLLNQNINHKLPQLLPDDVEIAHKTGELGPYSHDAGLVFTDNGDYIIVVMTKSESPENANNDISEISKTVYDYFSGF